MMIPSARPGPSLRAASSAILTFLLVGCPALAQTPTTKPPGVTVPPPVSAEPGTTTASYGDWILRCQRVGTAEKSQHLCEVAQVMQVQGQAAPVAQIAIGHPPGEADLRVIALLPVAVSFPSNVQITLSDKDARGGTKADDAKSAEKRGILDLVWRRCMPGGCLADGPAINEVLKLWRGTESAGRILFKDAGGREVVIPLSFRGLGSALDALANEHG